MSRTRRRERIESPVQIYVDWAGDKGKLVFYNKETQQTTEAKGMKFVVLDIFHTVSGFKQGIGGYRGTEVKNLKEEKIRVYLNGKKKYEDYWENLKGKVPGIKYAKSFYIALLTKNGYKLAKLTLKGSSFGAYLNFIGAKEEYEGNDIINESNIYDIGIVIAGKSKLKKNGATKYYEPNFDTFELSEDDIKVADDLDMILQEYFDKIAERRTDFNEEEPEEEERPEKENEEEEEDYEEEDEEEDIDVDDLLF